MYERLNGLFSKDDLNKLHNTNILLVGVGGVGSICFECLIRSGILNITIIDHDTYELSNLNRQLPSTMTDIDKKKVDVLKKYALDINKDINIKVSDEFLNLESKLDYQKYDYIIDACDSVNGKINLILNANKYNIPIISCMGIGNRKNPSELIVTSLNKINDPLANKLKKELKKFDYNNDIKVIASKEVPIKSKVISSYICNTMSAGCLLADEVIKDIIK